MSTHHERHRAARGGWLRAAILGADDGIVSIASLMMGVAASAATQKSILVAGLAGLVGGALSMAAGEYVSVSSQRDAEEADIAVERRELAADPAGELAELTGIYLRRGLDEQLARKVAEQLSARGNRLVAHLRDELGIDPTSLASPQKAALVSAASFGSLGLVPIGAVVLAPASARLTLIATASLVSLAILGAVGGRLGGAPMLKASLRVTLGGGLAMALTTLIGHFVGRAV